MHKVPKLNFKRVNTVRNFIQYGIVGVLGTVVHTGILTFCVEVLDIRAIFSTILGFIGSLILSFKLNSIWTFKNNRKANFSFLKYLTVCSVGLLINVFIMFLTVDLFRSSYFIGQAIAILVVPIFNFTLSKYWAFSANNSK